MASTREKNVALVREFLTTAIAGSDTDALGMFLGDAAVDGHAVIDSGLDSETGGPAYWRVLARADIDIAIDTVVAAEEQVAIRGTVTRCSCASLRDGAPTHHSVEIAVAWFCRIENGHIGETWSLPDGSWLVRHLDALPGGT